jgi:type III secretion protein T
MKDTFAVTSLGLLDHIMGLIITFAAPVVIAMFIAEFGLGLMNRFAPQLNVFFLAMPVKSGIAAVIIIFYLVFLLGFLQKEFVNVEKLKIFYAGLFQ